MPYSPEPRASARHEAYAYNALVRGQRTIVRLPGQPIKVDRSDDRTPSTLNSRVGSTPTPELSVIRQQEGATGQLSDPVSEASAGPLTSQQDSDKLIAPQCAPQSSEEATPGRRPSLPRPKPIYVPAGESLNLEEHFHPHDHRSEHRATRPRSHRSSHGTSFYDPAYTLSTLQSAPTFLPHSMPLMPYHHPPIYVHIPYAPPIVHMPGSYPCDAGPSVITTFMQPNGPWQQQMTAPYQSTTSVPDVASMHVPRVRFAPSALTIDTNAGTGRSSLQSPLPYHTHGKALEELDGDDSDDDPIPEHHALRTADGGRIKFY
ncbi:hypothetical protein MRB53_041830 [Persea americana]|nr:hypothetical protein MRB53_041830 [Persea americana]